MASHLPYVLLVPLVGGVMALPASSASPAPATGAPTAAAPLASAPAPSVPGDPWTAR